MRGRAHPLHRDHVGQARVGVDMPFHHVQEIDHAAVFQTPGNLQPVLARETARHILVPRVAHTDDELGPDPVADRFQRVEGEAQAPVQIPPIGAVQCVGQRRPKLIHQVPVGLQLDPVEASRLHPFGGIGVVRDDPGHVPVLGLFRKRLVRRLAFMAGRHDREPVGLVPPRPAAKVGQLDHHRAAMFVALVRQGLHPAHDLVLPRQNVVEHRRTVAGDARRPRRHRQRHARPRPFHVIGAIAILGHPVLGIGRLVTRNHQPVLQRQVFELIGLEKRVVGHGNLRGSASDSTKCSLMSSLETCLSIFLARHRPRA